MDEKMRSPDSLRTGGSMKPFDLPTQGLGVSLPSAQAQVPPAPPVAAGAGLSQPYRHKRARGCRPLANRWSENLGLHPPTPPLPSATWSSSTPRAPPSSWERRLYPVRRPLITWKRHNLLVVWSPLKPERSGLGWHAQSCGSIFVRVRRFSKDFLREEGERNSTSVRCKEMTRWQSTSHAVSDQRQLVFHPCQSAESADFEIQFFLLFSSLVPERGGRVMRGTDSDSAYSSEEGQDFGKASTIPSRRLSNQVDEWEQGC